MLATHKAVKDMLDVFVREGSTDAIADRLTPFEEYNRFVGLATEIAGVIAFRCE
jgi:methylisocitrate lyase